MPRKVAELLRSDEFVHAALTRLSSLVRAKGLNARVIERILVGRSEVAEMTLNVLSGGLCGEDEAKFPSLTAALKGHNLTSVWRAGLIACYVDFVHGATRRTGLPPNRIYGTAWANAETAFWVAGKHVVDPDETFVQALFLDVGLVAMMYALPEVYTAFAHSADSRSVEEFEAASFGFDHQVVSAHVLTSYKFPEDLADLAVDHHAPLLNLDMYGKVLRAAVVAAASVGGDFGLGVEPLELDKPTLEGALLKPSDVDELRLRASSNLQRALEFRAGAGNRAA